MRQETYLLIPLQFTKSIRIRRASSDAYQLFMKRMAHEEETSNVRKASHITTDPVSDGGFTLPSTGSTKPSIDIVFVHGLQGHPEMTWTYSGKRDKVPKPESSKRATMRSMFRRETRGSSRHELDATQSIMFWPRDLLLNDVPKARILTYGHESKVSHFFGHSKPNHDNLAENGRNFMHRLAA